MTTTDSSIPMTARGPGHVVWRAGIILATAAILVATLWLAVAGLPDVAHAATKTVCAGGDFTTIQAAVDSAGPGDVIQICAGTYPESVNLSTMGSVGNITLRASSTPVLIRPGSGSALYITEDFTGSVTLAQLDVRSPTAPGIEFSFGNWILGNLTLDRVVANNNAANGIIASVDGPVVVTGTQASYNRDGMTVDFNYSGIYLDVTGDVEVENTETISNNGWGVYIYFTQRPSVSGVVAAAPAQEVACVGSAAFTITNLTANENAYDGLYVSSGTIIQLPKAFASIVGAINDSTFEYNLWNGAFVKIQRDPYSFYSNGACTSRLTVDGSVAEENGYVEMLPFTTVQAAAPALFAPFSGFTLWSADTQVSNSLAEANYYAGVLVSPYSGFYDDTVAASVAAVVVPIDTASFQIVDSTLLYNEVGLEATDTRLVSVTNVTVYSNTNTGVLVGMNSSDLAAGGHAGVHNSWIMDNGQNDPSTDEGGGIILERFGQPVLVQVGAANVTPQATVDGNLICRNLEVGLEAAGVDVAAPGNWWNSATGPTNSQNPGGTGDVVKESPVVDGVGPISGTVDFTPWIDSVFATATPSPTVAGASTNVVFQFSDQAKSVFLGVGPGDRNGPPPFTVTTDNGVIEDPAGDAASVTRFLSLAQGTLPVTVIPAQPGTATVTVMGPCGPVQSITIPVAASAVAISKQPAYQMVAIGGQAAFSITVTNTGNSALTDVTVADPLTLNCAKTLPDLAPAASIRYTCSGIATADFVNVATVSALPSVNVPAVAGSAVQAVVPVTNTATAVVDVVAPSLALTKTATTDPLACGGGGPLTVVAGTPVYFCVTVANTGDITLTNHLISDPLLLLNNVPVTYPLAPGSVLEIKPMTLVPFGGPALGPLTPTVSITNTVVVTASLPVPVGGPIAATATSQVRVDELAPAVAIAKQPAYQAVASGGQADFTITVTNTGSTRLTGVTVADPLTASCAKALPDLAPAASTSYTCSGLATADFVNVAEVSAVPVVAPSVLAGSAVQAVSPVTATASAVVDVVTPAVAISKLPAYQAVASGGQADFTITVTNTGNSALTDVTVADPLTASCAKALPDLAPAASTSYACSATATADFVNVAEVSAVPVVTPSILAGSAVQAVSPVTATASAVVDVVTPAVAISKLPAYQAVASGGQADFTITVTNTGNSALTDVTVADPLTASCAKALPDLAPAASTSYTCSGLATADFVNVAEVSAVPVVAPSVLAGSAVQAVSPVTATASAVVDVVTPAVAISKLPAYQMVPVGGQVAFSITVTNTGNTALTDVTVADPLTPSCAKALPDLAPAASTSYTCSATATADFVNVAAVSALPLVSAPTLAGSGGQAVVPVTDTAAAVVDVVAPSLALTKTATTNPLVCGGGGPLKIVAGTPVYFCVTVANTGDVTLTNHIVSDPLLLLNNVPVTYPLAPGAALVIMPFTLVPFGGPALGPLTPTVSITNTVVVTASLPIPVGGPIVAAAVSLVPVEVTPPTALDEEEEPNALLPPRLYLPAVVR